MEAPISRLPSELLLQVFESLDQDSYISNNTHNSLQHPFRAYKDCRLVSHRWKYLVDPLAFRRFRYSVDGEDVAHSVRERFEAGRRHHVSKTPTDNATIYPFNPFDREIGFGETLVKGEYCSLVRTLDIDLKLCSKATSIIPSYWRLTDEDRDKLQPHVEDLIKMLDECQNLSVKLVRNVVLSCRQLTTLNISLTLQPDDWKMPPPTQTVATMLAHVVDRCPNANIRLRFCIPENFTSRETPDGDMLFVNHFRTATKAWIRDALLNERLLNHLVGFTIEVDELTSPSLFESLVKVEQLKLIALPNYSDHPETRVLFNLEPTISALPCLRHLELEKVFLSFFPQHLVSLTATDLGCRVTDDGQLLAEVAALANLEHLHLGFETMEEWPEDTGSKFSPHTIIQFTGLKTFSITNGNPSHNLQNFVSAVLENVPHLQLLRLEDISLSAPTLSRMPTRSLTDISVDCSIPLDIDRYFSGETQESYTTRCAPLNALFQRNAKLRNIEICVNYPNTLLLPLTYDQICGIVHSCAYLHTLVIRLVRPFIKEDNDWSERFPAEMTGWLKLEESSLPARRTNILGLGKLMLEREFCIKADVRLDVIRKIFKKRE